MYTCNALAALWFCLALGATAKGDENGVPKPKDGLFSKKLSDGSTVVLEKESHREKRMPPKERPKGAPKDAVYVTAEFVVDHYRLAKLTGKEREVVWETKSEIVVGAYEGLGPRFKFWDAELVGDKVYVLYSSRLYAHLDVVARQSTGRWATIKSEVMKDRIRCLGIGKLFRDSGGLGIRFYQELPNGFLTNIEVWDIIDGTLRKHVKD
jgi:hypothetical protein